MALTTEHDLLQDEHDRLHSRHSDMIQDKQAQEAVWREKLEKIRLESQTNNYEHSEAIKELTSQNNALTETFKTQMKQLQDDHHRTMESLQQQLTATENQLFKLQQEHMAWASSQARAQDNSKEGTSDGASGASAAVVPSLEEREQGEVSSLLQVHSNVYIVDQAG